MLPDRLRLISGDALVCSGGKRKEPERAWGYTPVLIGKPDAVGLESAPDKKSGLGREGRLCLGVDSPEGVCIPCGVRT